MKILSSDIFFMNLSYYIDFINHQNNNIYKLGLQTSFPFLILCLAPVVLMIIMIILMDLALN